MSPQISSVSKLSFLVLKLLVGVVETHQLVARVRFKVNRKDPSSKYPKPHLFSTTLPLSNLSPSDQAYHQNYLQQFNQTEFVPISTMEQELNPCSVNRLKGRRRNQFLLVCLFKSRANRPPANQKHLPLSHSPLSLTCQQFPE